MYELGNILFARKYKTETYNYYKIERMRLKLMCLILGKILDSETDMYKKLIYLNKT